MFDFNKIDAKLRFIFNIQNQKQMATLLNLELSTYLTKRCRKSIPYKNIIDVCLKNNIDINYIFS